MKQQETLDNEAISALLDGELSDFELRRLMARLEAAPDAEKQTLLDTWERFNLTSAALQAEPLSRPLPARDGLTLADRVRLEIDGESLDYVSGTPAVTNRRWFAGLGKFAVAASVAAAVFVGLQTQIPDNDLQMAGNAPASDLGRQLAVDTEAQERLNDYIRSVSIPARIDNQSAPFNVLTESPLLRPVSDRELIPLDSLQSRQPQRLEESSPPE